MTGGRAEIEAHPQQGRYVIPAGDAATTRHVGTNRRTTVFMVGNTEYFLHTVLLTLRLQPGRPLWSPLKGRPQRGQG
jgi:hypothetical protein